ncbi:mechanosensitive ion channel protein 5-like [Euphorbia lathyris]|uniref:mechanosensitive ion channel protein 5-like n=1 Tax=Euphorbia lathyris TaxID=212925 RepID=UPI0033144019
MADNSGHRSQEDAGKIRRESRYDFRSDKVKDKPTLQNESENYVNPAHTSTSAEDPPSKLIGQFLHKQRTNGDFSLDMDLEMAELQTDTTTPINRHLPPISESVVTLDTNEDNESVRKRRFQFKNSLAKKSNVDSAAGAKDGELLKSSSRNDVNTSPSFKKKANLFKERTKSKSRLTDEPPEKPGKVVVRSGQLRSGFLGRVDHEEEDDPFDEDIPEKYRKDKLDIWVLLEWVSLILIIATLVSSLAFPFLRKRSLWKLSLWKWEVLVLVLICGRLVSRWFIRIIVFFVERNFLLRKRVLFFVYGLKKAVQNCLWLGLVLIAWHFLFDKKVQREARSETLRYVTKVLVCLVVGTLVWFVKTLVVKVLASSFNVNTYFDRIQESVFNQFLIETLSGPPLIEINMDEEKEKELATEIQKLQNAGAVLPAGLQPTICTLPQVAKVVESGKMQKSPPIGAPELSRRLRITIDQLHKLNQKNVSAWNMKKMMNIVRYGALSTLNEEIRDTSHHGDDESATKIRSEIEAKAAAKKIFHNVAKPGSRFIFLEDILRFMHEDEALKAFSLFDGASESKKISKSCLKNWVVHAFRERRALALTINDTKTAVKKLHRIVNVVVGSIVGVIWLVILGIATSKFLVFISSQLVLVAFIFGNTCKTVFESIIFLFVIHPFDVGDRCEIDGVQMVVEEMDILTTVFLRYDNQKIIIANSVLVTKAISNYYRSPDMGDGVEFLVHVATPPEKIALMRQRITCYMENKKEHWYPSPMVIFKELEDLNKIRIAVWFSHTINHQDMGEKFLRRSLLLEEIVKIFRELDMQYRLLPLDINVRALPPVSSGHIPPSWAS